MTLPPGPLAGWRPRPAARSPRDEAATRYEKPADLPLHGPADLLFGGPADSPVDRPARALPRSGPVKRAATVLTGGAALGVLGVLGAGSAHAAALAESSGDPVTIRLAATLQPGSLVISVPQTEVTLPSPTLSHGGTVLTSVGQLQPIAVTDNRSGDPGWTLSGEITGAAPGAAGFDGRDLGWNPSLVGESPGQRITLGLAVKPGPGTGTVPSGLAQPQVLAYTTNGVGLGTAHLSASLTLDLPTGTAAGLYSVTLTLTAI